MIDPNARPAVEAKTDAEAAAHASKEAALMMREIRQALTEQNEILRTIMRRLDSVAKKRAEELRILELETQAILRKLYIDNESVPYPNKLMAQAFRIQSQNGEDGISLAIFRTAGIKHRKFVEIGCGPNGGNSGFYAQELGWHGLMVDQSEANVSKVKQKFGAANIAAEAAWVGTHNVNELVEKNGLAGEIDLLSIDIDGNDYWVWEALTACDPRVVIVEYNSAFGPDRAVVVPYEQEFDRHQANRAYYGASLRALNMLAEKKGYRLVSTEPRGINGFFVRNDVAPEIPAASVESVFRVLEREKEGSGDFFAQLEQEGLPLVDLAAGVAG